MTTLVILRHGQTDWNYQHRYQGVTDIPLNAVGEEQAKQAHDFLKPFHFDAVYCSDLDRAKTTARLALKGIYPFEKIIFDRRLRERSFGSYEGGPYDKEFLPDEYRRAMAADPENFKFPEGESLNEVKDRLEPFYREILKKHPDETVLLVAHGSLLSMLMFLVEDKPVCDKTRNHLKNAEPLVLQVSLSVLKVQAQT